MEMDSASDEELMSRVQTGDKGAFTQVVERYQDRMMNYLTRLTGDRARAEDMAQEAFIKLFTHADRYSHNGRLAGYLYKIATRVTLSHLRRDHRRQLLSALFLTDSSNGDSAETPQTAAIDGERHRLLARAIGELPVSHRVPLVLHELEGLSYEDIAEVTGDRIGTIKSRVSRGRANLRRQLMPLASGGEL
jgi:RNA polymerase sigma-70 factor (ECF subfamily)